jgi:hypothetical protein
MTGVGDRRVRPTGTQVVLGTAAVACYALGYPLAILGDSSVGWALVTLGGVFLLSLGVVTIRLLHRGT